MYKLNFITVFFLIFAGGCSTNSSLAPLEVPPIANNNDLINMNDCNIIKANLLKTQQSTASYKKAKQLNTSANLLSGLVLILSFGMGELDYVSNQDLNKTIKSYEDRLVQLKLLHEKYCRE